MRKIITGASPLAINYHPPEPGKARTGNSPIWITPLKDLPKPGVMAYRLKFRVAEAVTATIHVSADERYELWLDGQRLGRGPQAGCSGMATRPEGANGPAKCRAGVFAGSR